MKVEQEEIFIEKCVKYFNDINELITIRGTPESSNVLKNREKVKSVWEKITNEMNELYNVITDNGINFKNQ